MASNQGEYTYASSLQIIAPTKKAQPQENKESSYSVTAPAASKPSVVDENQLQEEDHQNLAEIGQELALELGDDDFDGTFVPSSIPSVNGKLSAHAAEFWFPGSRECQCCHGFKYGCNCAKNGFLACQLEGCVDEENRGEMVDTTELEYFAEIDQEIALVLEQQSLDETAGEYEFVEEEETHLEQAGAFVPSSIPSVNGKLSAHAAEFWFPGSRECPCCHGFKYGCNCAKNGFLACQLEGCVDEENRGKKSAGIAKAAASPKGTAGDSSSPNGTCRYELMSGGCRFGSSCRFRHVQSASSSLYPDNPQGYNSYNTYDNYNQTRKPCQHFFRGYCPYGDSCYFSHA